MTQPPPVPATEKPKRSLVKRVVRGVVIFSAALVAFAICSALVNSDESPTATTVAAASTDTTVESDASDAVTDSTAAVTTAPTTTSTTAPAPTTTTTTIPDGSFGDGVLIVGQDLDPGTYVSVTGSCYWARLSGFSGDFDEIIANDNTSGQAVVSIADSDVGFESNGCRLWIPLESYQPEMQSVFADGVLIVGLDIAPGVYEATSSGCYWQRMSSFDGSFDGLIANDNSTEHTIVEISDSDVGFSSSGCQLWQPLDESVTPLTTFGEGVWAVGIHIEPGLYATDGGDGCYWQRMSGFGGGFSDLITNDLPDGQAVVEIKASDVGFSSSGCGTWTQR